MPLRGVADHLRTKWRRHSSRMTSSGTVIKPDDMKRSQQQQQQRAKSKASTEGDSGAKNTKDRKSSSSPPKDYPPSPDTLLNGIGDYLFLNQLGHGKFSKVMLAQHYLTGEKYAVKIIDKRIHDYRVMSRLVREITLMEVIDHPNIVHLYETYETADSLYLVMEYVPGVNLEEHLQRCGGVLQEDEARAIFRQMVAAVDYCHSRWVVHRDLKAPNVLLTPDGNVKLIDLGPEIISGQKYIGPEVDCWCLGVSLFRMTSGFEPFAHAHTVGELRKDVISGNYPMPVHLSEGLQRTIRKCLSVDRRRRMALQVALKDDPWLNNHGQLEDLFATKRCVEEHGSSEMDEVVRLKAERERSKRQHLKDLEEERRTGYHVKKTIIYHPINQSIYFTSSTPHTSKMEVNLRSRETLRASLFQEIQTILHQVRLEPVQHARLSDMKSPLHYLFRKFKRPDPKSRLKKTTSTLSLSQLYQRVTNDQINYYTIQANVRGLSSTTAVDSVRSSFSSFSMSNSYPYSIRHGSFDHHATQKDEYELILLVRSACELLGVTYQHDAKMRLTCMMTLRQGAINKNRGSWFYSLVPRDSRHDGAASTPTLLQKPPRSSSNDLVHENGRRSSSFMDKISNSSQAKASRWSRQFKRLSMPLHQWSNSIHFNSSSAAISNPGSMTIGQGSFARTASQQQLAQRPTAPPPPPEEPAQDDKMNQNKDGTVIFTIEAFSVPGRNKDESRTAPRMVGIRFSKVKGSSKVFKLASGWISGVLATSVHDPMYNESLNTDMDTSA
ncbi:Map microtubule affinity-regulating kinase [Apophysomyces sp. BC1015]|nr:Map microtubule affinity-regulating kinase [Apophysomyces sp. BC1015]KAG0182242.1 Map microtubule affinity-regulating kinase [Apophysomyces sp. BC1021]